jgi:hypothetical protein
MWDQSADTTVHTPERRGANRRAVLGILALSVAVVAAESLAYRYPLKPASGILNLGGISDSTLRLPSLVVLETNPDDLQTIIANAGQRGRKWEPSGRVSFLAAGVLKFESAVGVRIHGDISRHSATNQKSFRLYFRKILEATNAPGPAIGFEGERSHNILVLHGDERHSDAAGEWHYSNPLAYDIAKKIGVMTAETLPAALVINGGAPQPYVITEYVDLDYFASRFGHRNFEIYDSKDLAPWLDSAGPVVELRARYGDSRNWTVEQIGQLVDIDNLSRWYLTTLFCGTHDLWQGKLVRDQSRRDAKWFWVAQDLDASFLEYDEEKPFPPPVWEYDRPMPPRDFPDPRIIILRQLFTHEEFRRSFAKLFVDVRDNMLTPEFLNKAISRYEQAATVYGVKNIEYQGKVRAYLKRRPVSLRQQLAKYLRIDVD